jgi:hypothetical protein
LHLLAAGSEDTVQDEDPSNVILSDGSKELRPEDVSLSFDRTQADQEEQYKDNEDAGYETDSATDSVFSGAEDESAGEDEPISLPPIQHISGTNEIERLDVDQDPEVVEGIPNICRHLISYSYLKT